MTRAAPSLERGAIVWVDFDPTAGREQRGTRPALVVPSADYLTSVRDLTIVVPITSVTEAGPTTCSSRATAPASPGRASP